MGEGAASCHGVLLSPAVISCLPAQLAPPGAGCGGTGSPAPPPPPGTGALPSGRGGHGARFKKKKYLSNFTACDPSACSCTNDGVFIPASRGGFPATAAGGCAGRAGHTHTETGTAPLWAPRGRGLRRETARQLSGGHVAYLLN